LRDDIIFRRLELNPAIAEYQRISEGRSLVDVIWPEFKSIAENLEKQAELHQRQVDILTSLEEVRLSGGQQTGKATMESSIASFQKQRESLVAEAIPKLKAFRAKLDKVGHASGDYDGQERILQSLEERLNQLDAGYQWTLAERQRLLNEDNTSK